MKFLAYWIICCLFIYNKAYSQIPSVNLMCWLKSDAGLVSTGNQLNSWHDQSGNAFHFSTLSPPQITTKALASFQGIQFNSNYLLSDSVKSFNDFTIFIIFKKNGTIVPYERLMDQNISTGFWSGRDANIVNTFGGGYKSYGVSSNFPDSVANIFCLNKNNNNWEIYNTNLVQVQQTISDPSASTTNKISLACDLASLSNRFDGYYFEVIMYDAALSNTDRNQVFQYLHNKYAPDINLGPDISFCSSPVVIHPNGKYYTKYLWNNGTVGDTLVVNSPGKYYVTAQNIFGGLTTDTILVVQDIIPRTVLLGNDTTICSGNSVIINAGMPELNYSWSNGITTNTVLISTQGNYTVTMVDCLGNISKDSINITVQPLPVFNFGSNDTIICPNSNFILDPGLGTSTGLTFHWQDNLNTSTHNASSNGQYYLDVTNNIGCKFSDTINIQTDISMNNISLGADISLCAGNLITLTSGATQPLTYLWNDFSTNDSIAINSTGQYSVVVTNTNSCTANDTINITVSGQAPTANFSSNIGCQNKFVLFTNLSIPPLGNTIDTTIWSFGEPLSSSNTSTLTNPAHTYTSTGTYTVSLKVITDSGCAQSIIKTINVYPAPTATFVIGTSCQNDSTAFLNQSTGITGYSITSSYWNFGDASPTNTTNIISPKHVFGTATTHTVKLLVTNTVGCKDSVLKSLTVQSEVKANFTNSPACLNNVTSFQNTSIIPPAPNQPTYLWSFGIGTGTTNVVNPVKTYSNSGVYPVTLFVDGTNGCVSTITKLVNVYLPPITSFSIPSFCSKDTAHIINLSNPQSGIMSSYNWKLNNNTFSSIQSPTLSLTTAGTYSVRLTTINSFGCKDSVTHSLTIFPLPVVDFSTTPTAFYYENEPVNFIPSIANANSYLWNINGTSTYTIQSPTETFSTENSYNISLNLKDQNGCKGSKTKNITVSKRHLDLAILNVNTTKDNDGFMTVVAEIANYGSVPINSFKMGYQISDGGNIKETWNGTLNPNSFYTFTFNATSASLQNSSNNITCVEIEKVNTIIDDNTTNNSLCNSLNTDGIYVDNPLPNPTNGDIVLPITLNRGFDYTIAIYNSVGQIQYEETTKKGIEGLNFVTLNTSSYAHGAYIIKVMIDEKIFIKKFIKVSYQ